MDRVFLGGFKVDSSHGAGCVCLRLAFGCPVFIETDEKLAVEQVVDVGLCRQAELLHAAWEEQIKVVLKRGPIAHDDNCAMSLTVREDARPIAVAVVLSVAAEDFFRAFEGLAPL